MFVTGVIIPFDQSRAVISELHRFGGDASKVTGICQLFAGSVRWKA